MKAQELATGGGFVRAAGPAARAATAAAASVPVKVTATLVNGALCKNRDFQGLMKWAGRLMTFVLLLAAILALAIPAWRRVPLDTILLLPTTLFATSQLMGVGIGVYTRFETQPLPPSDPCTDIFMRLFDLRPFATPFSALMVVTIEVVVAIGASFGFFELLVTATADLYNGDFGVVSQSDRVVWRDATLAVWVACVVVFALRAPALPSYGDRVVKEGGVDEQRPAKLNLVAGRVVLETIVTPIVAISMIVYTLSCCGDQSNFTTG
jgi:hypothetical protein